MLVVRARTGVAEVTGIILLVVWAIWFTLFDVLNSSPATRGWGLAPWWFWAGLSLLLGGAHGIAIWRGSITSRRRYSFLRATMLFSLAMLSVRYGGIGTLALPTFFILALESMWVYAKLREKPDDRSGSPRNGTVTSR